MAFDEKWEKMHAARQWGKYPSEMLVRFMMGNYKNAPNRKAIKVLEIGCGAGANLSFVAKEGFSAYAFDGSKSAILNARKFMAAENLAVELTVADAADIDNIFAGEEFDVIFETYTLCHIPGDIADVIVKKLAKRLKPGGRFFSMGFATGTWGDGLGEKIGVNTYRDVTEGPFAGMGLVRFSTLADYEKWGAIFSGYNIEEMSYTANNRRNAVKYFILSAQK